MRTTRGSKAFTLIEVLLAGAAAAVLLAAMYGLMGRAIKLRDSAEAHAREGRLRARALSTLRNDLLNAHIVGTEMSGGLLGGESGPVSSRFPGYLRFTTSTGRDSEETPYGDTQEVEYYIEADPESANADEGVLIRTVDRVLLADTREITAEERLLTKVASMELSFYDGTDWTESWETTEETPELPLAVRVTIYPYAENGVVTPPIELLVPWTTQKP